MLGTLAFALTGAFRAIKYELDWLGVHPDAYGLAAQGLVLALIALFYGRDWWRSRQLRPAVEV